MEIGFDESLSVLVRVGVPVHHGMLVQMCLERGHFAGDGTGPAVIGDFAESLQGIPAERGTITALEFGKKVSIFWKGSYRVYKQVVCRQHNEKDS